MLSPKSLKGWVLEMETPNLNCQCGQMKYFGNCNTPNCNTSSFESVMEVANYHITLLENELNDIQQHISIYLRETNDLKTQALMGFNIRNADLIHLLQNLDLHLTRVENIELDLSSLLIKANGMVE